MNRYDGRGGLSRLALLHPTIRGPGHQVRSKLDSFSNYFHHHCCYFSVKIAAATSATSVIGRGKLHNARSEY